LPEALLYTRIFQKNLAATLTIAIDAQAAAIVTVILAPAFPRLH